MTNPRNRRQEVVRIFDGRVHHVALCRGFLDNLPVFGWGEAPSILLTRTQLRDAGLRPNGQDPLALLVFRHHRAYRHEEVATLYSVELAAPRRVPTPAQLRGIDRALQARRMCVACTREQDYYVPTSTRQCWACFDAEDMAVAA
jgi:hypothetical protein